MRRRSEPLEAGARRAVRCAAYTRKSSEQGLEQDFNSLEAQREAAEAYILSQRHEGWRLVRTRYDDGGFSGGTLERPALRQLLDDIRQRRIDVVVVYKVDRLTRSLGDFAKLVETFDTHGVSFVSVTQQFNTTTSMGRLTLNVLLSFAQFEREVTGERIRDKFAASRAKGMWMGGHPPLGYDLRDRKLIVNQTEAKLVRHIFKRFCALGTVAKLKAELNRKGHRTKARVSNAGRRFGGTSFTRGALYHILHNRAYLGEVDHKGKVYPGEHAAIVAQELWDRAQAQIAQNLKGSRNGRRAASPSLLKGFLFDDAGNRMSPSHAVKRGKRYRYYVSQAILQHRKHDAGSVIRVPAHEIEQIVTSHVDRLVADPKRLIESLEMRPGDETLRQAIMRACRRYAYERNGAPSATPASLVRAAISRVSLGESGIEIVIAKPALLRTLLEAASQGQRMKTSDLETDAGPDEIVLHIPVSLGRTASKSTLIVPAAESGLEEREPNATLVKAIARGHVWAQKLVTGEVRSLRALGELVGLPERYVSRIVRLGFLAPELAQAIIDGRQSKQLALRSLWNPPLDWTSRRI